MIYNTPIEIVKESDINKVNEYLSTVEEVTWYTSLVYDIIGCVTETVEPGVNKTVYILGKMYKQQNYSDKQLP